MQILFLPFGHITFRLISLRPFCWLISTQLNQFDRAGVPHSTDGPMCFAMEKSPFWKREPLIAHIQHHQSIKIMCSFKSTRTTYSSSTGSRIPPFFTTSMYTPETHCGWEEYYINVVVWRPSSGKQFIRRWYEYLNDCPCTNTQKHLASWDIPLCSTSMDTTMLRFLTSFPTASNSSCTTNLYTHVEIILSSYNQKSHNLLLRRDSSPRILSHVALATITVMTSTSHHIREATGQPRPQQTLDKLFLSDYIRGKQWKALLCSVLNWYTDLNYVSDWLSLSLGVRLISWVST